MKPTLNKMPRAERTLEYYFAEIMESVIDIYLLCVPEHDRASFMTLIYEPLKEIELSGDAVLRYFYEAGVTQLGKGDLTLLACIYCLQSGWARVDGQIELAWSYLMEAQLYIAMSTAADISEPQLAKILDLARTEAKSKAAKESVAVSVNPWRETKQEAIRLIEEKARNGQRWASEEKAALEILDDVKKFLKTRQSKKQKNFWTNAPEKTVATWLRRMSNAGSLFGDHNDNNPTK